MRANQLFLRAGLRIGNLPPSYNRQTRPPREMAQQPFHTVLSFRKGILGHKDDIGRIRHPEGHVSGSAMIEGGGINYKRFYPKTSAQLHRSVL